MRLGKFHGIEPLERQSLREARGISPPGQDAYTRPPGLIVKGDDLEIGLMVIRNGDVRFSCVQRCPRKPLLEMIEGACEPQGYVMLLHEADQPIMVFDIDSLRGKAWAPHRCFLCGPVKVDVSHGHDRLRGFHPEFIESIPCHIAGTAEHEHLHVSLLISVFSCGRHTLPSSMIAVKPCPMEWISPFCSFNDTILPCPAGVESSALIP